MRFSYIRRNETSLTRFYWWRFWKRGSLPSWKISESRIWNSLWNVCSEYPWEFIDWIDTGFDRQKQFLNTKSDFITSDGVLWRIYYFFYLRLRESFILKEWRLVFVCPIHDCKLCSSSLGRFWRDLFFQGFLRFQRRIRNQL